MQPAGTVRGASKFNERPRGRLGQLRHCSVPDEVEACRVCRPLVAIEKSYVFVVFKNQRLSILVFPERLSTRNSRSALLAMSRTQDRFFRFTFVGSGKSDPAVLSSFDIMRASLALGSYQWL